MAAQGGRIGYKDGPEKPGRRTFMKAAAGLASLLPFGIGKGVKMAAPVVAKAAEISGPALAKLVETVMSAGKFISLKGRKVKEMVTKKKLGKVEVEEDIADGSYIIKKDGKEIYYKPGKFLNASLDKASEENERNFYKIKSNKNNEEIIIVQIAGLIARRIVCEAEQGQELKQGDRIGMIRFGSRVDLYFKNKKVLAKLGQNVVAGESLIASE